MIPQPLIKRLQHRCLVCEHPLSAMSDAAMQDAMNAHTAYVNRRDVDRQTDPHFATVRMDALLLDAWRPQ